MKQYTDEEIIKMFPGPNGVPVANIVPQTYIRRSLDADKAPYLQEPVRGSIAIRYATQTGVDQFTRQPIVETKNYIVRFPQLSQPSYGEADAEIGKMLAVRTDNLGNISKEIPPVQLIRLLLQHDGHKDQNGNVIAYTLESLPFEVVQAEELKRGPGRPRKEEVQA